MCASVIYITEFWLTLRSSYIVLKTFMPYIEKEIKVQKEINARLYKIRQGSIQWG